MEILALHEPKLTLQDEETVLDALRSGWVSTGGPYVDQFEKDFAEFVEIPYAVSVSNGTLALQLMIECVKRLNNCDQPFDILAPDLSFVATWNAIIHSGGAPNLVDVDHGTLNMCWNRLSEVIEKEYQYHPLDKAWFHKVTKRRLLAVMPAHIMGWTPEMSKIYAICKQFNIPVIEDAAESLGSRFVNGAHVGGGGAAACFSFNGNKILTTGGGGMLVTHDPEFAKLAKHLSTTAKTDGLRYVHDQSGFNFRLVNILAALGCSQLKNLPQTLKQKSIISGWYARELSGVSSVKLHIEQTCTPNHWINNIVFHSENLREKALAALIAQNIQCRPLWTPGHRLPFIQKYQRGVTDFKETDAMWRTTLSLPSSAHLAEESVKRIVDIVKFVVQS